MFAHLKKRKKKIFLLFYNNIQNKTKIYVLYFVNGLYVIIKFHESVLLVYVFLCSISHMSDATLVCFFFNCYFLLLDPAISIFSFFL